MQKEKKAYSRLVTLVDGVPHYIISFRDALGNNIEIDLNNCTDLVTARKVFYEVQVQLREDMRQYRSDYRHNEHLALKPEEISDRALIDEETPEEIIIRHELGERLVRAMETLPEKQKRRFKLRHIHELKECEIARLEGCSQPVVHRSIKNAERFLGIVIKNYREGV